LLFQKPGEVIIIHQRAPKSNFSQKREGIAARRKHLKARVLIVEDEQEIGNLIALYLKKESLETILVDTAEKALIQLREGSYDLVVLDINLPGMDGFEFLQELRRESDMPVLIVSARDEDEDLVLGLGIGADDFVTKPFSPKVLAARVRAHLRRARKVRPTKGSDDLVRFGPFTLDLSGHILEREGKRIPLPPMEFELLSLLTSRPGEAMGPEQIYEALWGQEYGDIATVAVHVRRLRKRIESDPTQPVYIETIRGAGYRFNPEMIGPAK
jgi:DNA-binding response OmpR family regulator